MARIALDAGHGLHTPGKRCMKRLDPKGTREWTLNQRIANYVEEGLKNYKDVAILRSDDRTGKVDVSLSNRVRKINNFKPDVVYSYHHNAGANGTSAGGITVHIAPNSSSASKRYRKGIYDALIKHTGLKGNRDSPLSTDNFYILRNTKAPAVLIEHGFMDSSTDVPIILTDSFARKCANAHVEYIVKTHSLVKKSGASKPAPKPKPKKEASYYRVRATWANEKSQKGAFKDLYNAIDECKKHKGYRVYDRTGRQVYPITNVKPLFRVRKSWSNPDSQIGAYSNLDNAMETARANKGYNVYDDNDKIIPITEPEKKPKPEPKPPAKNKVAIVGKSIATAKQMATVLLERNNKPKIEVTALELAELFIEEGNLENIRGDIAFAQSMKETGWLSYGGLVLPEQNNYSGIGATNNSKVGKGAWFKTEREGVRAQIQHLKAYANKLPLKSKNVDPRFHLVPRGIAPNWTDLNGRWAVPGTTYGQEILDIYEIFLKVVVKEEEEKPKNSDSGRIKKLEDEVDKIKEELKEYRTKFNDISKILNK